MSFRTASDRVQPRPARASASAIWSAGHSLSRT